MPEPGVLGVFLDPAKAASTVRELRARGFTDIRVASPAPFPGIVEALGKPPSRLGYFTLSAAVLGVGAGFALCIATSLAWPLPTGGKPVVSIPPFVIIAFELSVLVGATVNLIALAVGAFLARRKRGIPVAICFTRDKIGIFVAGAGGGGPEAERTLRAGGARELHRVP